MNNEILKLEHITKKYPGVVALDDVSIGFYEGEVHAIAGENGAGKSTLIKIVTGAIEATSGSLFFNGQELVNNTPEKTLAKGIAAIYQEFNLFPSLTVAENIFHGRYPRKHGMIDKKTMMLETEKILKDLDIHIKASELVKNLSVGYQQLVEIAKSVTRDVKVLIMDEPSAPLTEVEVGHLFEIVNRLKKRGVTILYISHRLEEIFTICDRVSVFRDGKYIQTMNVSDTSVNELISIMVNRELGQQYPEKDYVKGEKVLEIHDLCTDLLDHVSLEAYRGEILGLAGLVGAGRTETVRALFGADRIQQGEILINGKKIQINSPTEGIKNGIGLIPEDRKKQGLVLNLSVRHNISFASLRQIKRHGIINMDKDRKASEHYINQLSIKTPSCEQKTGQLSGGNQQKVVLAKWLFGNSDILIFDEPTRGIDVGAKQEIYRLMVELVKEGKVIIMISSDMPELIGMSDRILVMHSGKVMGELQKDEYSQERILRMASGIEENGAEVAG